MIGVVGPKDSVALAQQVADDLGRAAEIVGVTYHHADEAVPLARSLETSCEVVLFTGQAPYEQARRDGEWQCELDVIQHSQADLYRTIALVLKETRGRFPRVSVDSLDPELVRDVFEDMALRVPDVILPLVDDAGTFVFEDEKGTARAHLAAMPRGRQTAVLTCLAGTYQALTKAGVTVWRIDHARVTIVEALQRAWLTADVRRSRGSSIAVVLVRPGPSRGSASTRFERALRSHARRMGSHVVSDGDRFLLTTTQAAIEAMLRRHREGQQSLVDLATKAAEGSPASIGIGLGGTFVTALDLAQKALQVAANTAEPTIAREDGTVDSLLDSQRVAVNLQETSEGALELAQQTGLGPLSLRRLVAALGRTDYAALTAQQLAEFYGVQPRSARRMLGLLVEAGYAREAGVRGAVGAGRPHVVYEVDLPTLTRVMSSGSTGVGPASR